MTNPILKVQYNKEGATYMTNTNKPLPKGKHFLAPVEGDTSPLASGWTLELDGKATGFYGAYMEVAALAMFETSKQFRIHRMPDAAKGV